jgi:hypothetical protein
MKLSTRDDIEAPLDFVFAELSDFEGWETAALRRGADVVRADARRGSGVGMGWKVQFVYRGKPRAMTIHLTDLAAPTRLAFQGEATTVEGGMTIELVELSARRTRVVVGTEVKPRTLAARLVLQSLKLAKGKVQKKFDTRVAQLCRDIENRYRARTGRVAR